MEPPATTAKICSCAPMAHRASSSEKTPVAAKPCDSRTAVATSIFSGDRPTTMTCKASVSSSAGPVGPTRGCDVRRLFGEGGMERVVLPVGVDTGGKVGLDVVAVPGLAVGFGFPDLSDAPATRGVGSAGVGEEAFVGSHGRHELADHPAVHLLGQIGYFGDHEVSYGLSLSVGCDLGTV